MIVLESNSGNWAMDVRLREKIPRMARATNSRAVVTGCSTAER